MYSYFNSAGEHIYGIQKERLQLLMEKYDQYICIWN